MDETHEIPASGSDTWSVAEGFDGEMPILIRFRPGLAAFAGDARYPKRLTAVWSYATNDSGQPDDATLDALESFEDRLEAALDPDRLAVLTFTRTGQGERHLHYYLSDEAQVSERINGALEPGLPVDFRLEEDPEWRVFRGLLRACGADL
ncbi:MAG: DUF695 domain-containing protein [Planctomycetota bacterium]